jgi:glycosyltransferase involved in cell wall biosynthesis
MNLLSPHDRLEASCDSGSVSLRPYSEEWSAAARDLLGDDVCRRLDVYAIPSDLLLSVVIPVYNERNTLRAIVDRVKAVPIRKEIILIDDGSKDGSREIVAQLGAEETADAWNTIRPVFHQRNRGKGAAVRTGFAAAEGDIVLIQDADLECNPAEYPRLLRPILEDGADVVYGSRFAGANARQVIRLWHFLANKFLTTLSNVMNNLTLTDMETCYKVFRREVVKEIEPVLRQNRFGIEPEITAKIARRSYRIHEISISYSSRTSKQGKKINWRDGVAAIWYVLRYGIAD